MQEGRRLGPQRKGSAVEEREYTLAQLSEASGVPARTIRYYMQKGLLPRPLGKGPNSHYTLEHLHKLMAIRRLQDGGFSLDAIGRAFEEMEEQMPKTVLADAPEEALEEFRRRERRAMWSRVRPPTIRARGALPEEGLPYQPSGHEVGPLGQRSHWEHIALTSSIELHVRRPLPSSQRKGLEELLEVAKKLFGDDAGRACFDEKQ